MEEYNGEGGEGDEFPFFMKNLILQFKPIKTHSVENCSPNKHGPHVYVCARVHWYGRRFISVMWFYPHTHTHLHINIVLCA